MRTRIASVVLITASQLWPVHTAAGQAAPPVIVDSVAPRPADVATIDGIVKAFYDVVSGPAGQPRQWARDRTLYVDGIRFTIIERRDGNVVPHILTHQQFVDAANGDAVSQGLFEREINRVVRRFGDLAHVFSTYELRRKPEASAFARGVNSLELFFDGKRWWIASALWQDESPGNPIPAEFLPRRP